MLFLYNLGIRLYSVLLQFAYLKNVKARAWIDGRKNILHHIESEILPNRQHIWFHFASLGEFEQGQPVLKEMRIRHPESRILVTFFSPSGYEIRKNSPLADHVFYLPIDTKRNAERFIELIKPSIAIFTKYEYWYHYFTELKSKKIPLYIISGIFRKGQPFFKWYGGLHRQMLQCVTYFFVQNEQSRLLLQELDITNVAVSGDTRFDRVMQNTLEKRPLEEIRAFCGTDRVFIAGSTWPQDESLITELISDMPGWKFIIAPHEIAKDKIDSLAIKLGNSSMRYSAYTSSGESNQITSVKTLIIDNIGMLSALYQYGDIAYIGGGFGAGIHNTLEAAAFGIPVIFGPNYQKFKEAKDLLDIGGAFSISNFQELKLIAEKLRDENFRRECGHTTKAYVETNIGATGMILEYVDNQNFN